MQPSLHATWTYYIGIYYIWVGILADPQRVTASRFSLFTSSVFFVVPLHRILKHRTMAKNDKEKIDWGKVIQVAIAILTVIAGTFFESCTHFMADMRAMLMF